MKSSLFYRHTATLFQYAGIGLISGSISHGFFSTTRSFITAGFGIIVFLIGLVMEKHINMEKIGSVSALFIGVFFSIGTAMISGGAQHFLDSPWRSVTIMPIGYLVSLLMYRQKEGIKFSFVRTLGIGCVISFFILLITYPLAEITPSSLADHHDEIV